jgi:hypothetical protein
MKKITSLDDPMFKTLESEKMKKVTAGLNPCSQYHTATVTPQGNSDDGCDTLEPNEHQDQVC